MPGKYTPLENYLRALPESQHEVTLSFEQIERILNDKLPPSAYEYQAWWSYETNPRQPEKLAIANADWRVVHIDLTRKQIRLIRD